MKTLKSNCESNGRYQCPSVCKAGKGCSMFLFIYVAPAFKIKVNFLYFNSFKIPSAYVRFFFAFFFQCKHYLYVNRQCLCTLLYCTINNLLIKPPRDTYNLSHDCRKDRRQYKLGYNKIERYFLTLIH